MNSLVGTSTHGFRGSLSITRMSMLAWSMACLVFLVGCGASGASDLEIVSPEAGSVHSQMPSVEITWNGDRDDDENGEFTAFFNGTDVTQLFTVDDEEQTATAEGNELKEFLVSDGTNYLRASIGEFPVDAELGGVDDEDLSKGVYFTHETIVISPDSRPEIHITETMETGDSIQVSGYLSNYGTATSVSYWVASGYVNSLELYEGSVNTGEAELNGLRFTATLPMLDSPSMTIEFEAVYNNDSVIAQRFYRGDSKVLPKAIEIRENGAMINLAGNILKERFSGVLSAVKPQKIYDFGALEVVLKDVTFDIDDSSVEVAPSSFGGSDIDTIMTIDDLEIAVDICVDFLGKRCTDFDISSSSFEVIVPTDVTVGSNNRLGFGPIDFIAFDEESFRIDLPILRTLSGANQLVSTVVSNHLISLLNSFFYAVVTKVIDDVMGGLVMEQVTTTYSFDGNKKSLCTSGSFEDYQRDEQDLLVGIATDITPNLADVANPLGFRVSEFSSAQDRSAPSGEQFDVVISYSTNVFNQVLLGGYLAGMYHLDVDRFMVVNGKSFAFRLAPVAPPFTVVNDNDNTGLEFHVWDMNLELLALADEFSSVENWQTVAVGKIRIDGQIQFRLEDDANFGSMLSDNLSPVISELEFSEGFDGFDDETINRIGFLVTGPLGTAVSDSLSELGQPTLNGVTVPIGELWLDPQSAAYMIGIDVPEVCDPEQSQCPSLPTRSLTGCDSFDYLNQ